MTRRTQQTNEAHMLRSHMSEIMIIDFEGKLLKWKVIKILTIFFDWLMIIPIDMTHYGAQT